MQYDYNHIFLENRQLTNKTALTWMTIMAGFVSLIWMLSLFQIISISSWTFQITAPVSILILLLPNVLNRLMHLSDIVLVGRKGVNLLTCCILGCCLTAVFMMSVTLSHYAALAWLLPVLIACQYYSKRITAYTFWIGFAGMLISFFVSIFLHF